MPNFLIKKNLNKSLFHSYLKHIIVYQIKLFIHWDGITSFKMNAKELAKRYPSFHMLYSSEGEEFTVGNI